MVVFKLGIIGSDNSHADAFSKLANLGIGVPAGAEPIPDVQVTHIYGTDAERTKQVADAAKIPNIVKRSEDMLGAVDGVVCVWRHGSKHLHNTLPFLKAKIPAFVDKPLASSVADARQLIDTAQQVGVGFTSFSTLRYAKVTTDLVAELKKSAGTLTAGSVFGPADLNDQYDGIYFYGIHSAEVMTTVWGYGVQSVYAMPYHDNCVVICKYTNGAIVSLNLMHNTKYAFYAVAFGTNGWKASEVDSSTAYYDGMKVFLDVLRTGKWCLTPEQLLEPIKILAAIQKSVNEKREVALTEV